MSIVDRVAQRFAAQEHLGVAPPGWENTVKKMKKHDEIDNPWALAWHMKNKGDTPGGKKEGEEQEEASISRPGPMAAKVAKRFIKDGTVDHDLESALVHDGNGNMRLTVYQSESPARTAGDKPYRTHMLSSSASHFGVFVNSEFPLSSGSVVRWLIGALQRTLPVVEANESSYTRSDYQARPTVMNGAPVPDTRDFSTWQQGSSK